MADLVRVSLQGVLPGGEVWSVNPCFALFGSPTVSYAEALAATQAVNLLVPGLAIRGLNHSATALTRARLEFRSVAGILETQAEADRPSPAAGNGTGGPHPYQTSVVFSLRTQHAGGSGRGRLYWPATGLSLGAADYRISAANVTAQLTDMKTYLSAINTAVGTALGTDTFLAVWSRELQTLYSVERLVQGDVVDTQRRRRDALNENTQTLAYP